MLKDDKNKANVSTGLTHREQTKELVEDASRRVSSRILSKDKEDPQLPLEGKKDELNKDDRKTFRQCLYFDATAPMSSVDEVDRLFRAASAVVLVAWLVLLGAVYSTATKSALHYKDHGDKGKECLSEVAGEDGQFDGSWERNVAQTGFWILLVCTTLHILPLFFGSRSVDRHGRFSGVVSAALTVLMISLSTNALLAWGPSLVVLDPFTRCRVFLWRWCEWVVLAGLLTLMAGK